MSTVPLQAGDKVVDLAAGTGKLTRLLVARGLDVVAVEPIAEMRAVLRSRVPDADVREGTAEAIPLPDASVGAVTVAQAFHWFDPDRGPREIARVLKDDGALVIFVNVRDRSDPLQKELSQLVAPYRGRYPSPRWDVELPSNPLFETELRTFPHDHVVDRATLVERITSISWIASLPTDERGRVVDAARAIASEREEPIRLSYITQVFLCRRRSPAESSA